MRLPGALLGRLGLPRGRRHVLKSAGLDAVKLDAKLPFLGALLKKEQDLVALADQLSGGARYRS